MKHQPYKTVKTKLKNVIIDPYDIAKIQRDVLTLNTTTITVYQFIKAWCLNRFTRNESLPIINRDFIKSCFRALFARSKRGSKSNDEELVAELKKFRDIIYENYQEQSITGLYTALEYQIIDMETNYINNIVMHFPARLRKYIKCTIPLNPTGTKRENQQRIWAVYNSLVHSDRSLFPTDIENWYDYYRTNLLPRNILRCLEYDLKVNPFNYLWHMIFMDRILEQNGNKTFAAFPLKDSAIPGYIRLDTYYVGKKLNKDKTLRKGKRWVSTNQEAIFNNVCPMKIMKKGVLKENKLFKKRRYHFHHMIVTNGYTACLIFERNGYNGKEDQTNEENPKYGNELHELTKAYYLTRNIVGADPGKYNLLYLTDGDKKIRYTKNQRMQETGEKKYNKIMLKRRRETGIEQLESELSFFNRNSCIFGNFIDYIRAKNIVLNYTMNFYSQMWIRSWDFRKFRLKQKSEDKFLNKIGKTFGKDCVISYGDWKGNNQLKNQKATLGIGMRKIVEKKFDTFLTDEFRSSKLHYQCQNLLENAVLRKKEQHRCLKCLTCESRFGNSSSQSERSVFVNRDFNAAKNICYLGWLSLQDQDRPLHFRRDVSFSRLATLLRPHSLN